jgi:hypothetical protein
MTTNFAEKVSKIALIVEGETEIRFLTEYVGEIFSISLTKEDFIRVGTDWRGLENERIELLRRTDEGRSLLLIMDADKDTANYDQGGFAKRKTAIDQWLKKANIKANVFLWPNNSMDGTLETMLPYVAVKTHSAIFQCFEKYEECLRTSNRDYITPNEKAKIFAYAEALDAETSPTKRNYRDAQIWNLQSDFLRPLNHFLSTHMGATSL